MVEYIPFLMFGAVFAALLAGYPVAPTLAGVGLLFAGGGILFGGFSAQDLGFVPGRLYGIVTNQTLIAVPLFVFMGVMLERARIAERLLTSLSVVFSGLHGGLGIAVCVVGMLMAASTGIVGATVVTMGLMSLPTMLRAGYDTRLATGVIAATGTLGQIIPPSIALVLLGDVISNAYQRAQLNMGIFAPKTVSVADLFAGAVIPGLLLVALYMLYVTGLAFLRPGLAPPASKDAVTDADGNEVKVTAASVLLALVPPLVLIVAVLGSILSGFATPTEAAGVGALGAVILAALRGEAGPGRLFDVSRETMKTTTMVFFILIGASIFSLVFRGFGGEELVNAIFEDMPGGATGALIIVMLVVFLLGFILDFIEITFVVIPIVGPVLLALGIDPVWLGILLALNLQTSFLTPPFGFALFYLRGVAPPEVRTTQIYAGALPFIVIQLIAIGLVATFPALGTWLPELIYGR